MTINSYEKRSERIGPTSAKSSCSKVSNQNLRRMKFDYTADDSISSQYSKCDKFRKKKTVSPYLTEDRIEMLSKVTERRLVRKKKIDSVSSYPLAVNIYKVNSDELALALKRRKKAKKSVLTLPNEPAPLPQACTVSDMNDSEYFYKIKDERKLKPKNKRTIQTNRKPRINKAMQIFDRDAEYCSRLNIDLDSSSTDMINLFTGDGKKSTKYRNNKPKKSDINTHDVWAMLRSMNRFPFRPSPPHSDESITPIKKRNKYNKRRNSQMDTKFIETHTTEEFTYFSNSLGKSAHNSQSSFDRITVIDKQDAYHEICEELKFVENKIPSHMRSQKNNKKLKLKTKTRLSNAKVIIDGGDNAKLLHQNDTNVRQPNRFTKSQENKLMLTYDGSNDLNLGCINDDQYCQNKITKKASLKNNGSNDHIHLSGNTDGSSNGDMIKSLTGATYTFDDENKFNKLSPCDSQGQINSIIKVVLSKGQNIELTKNTNTPKRKQRSVTTMPSAGLYPKLTVAAIKRRLANIKFPLVILTKDELSSTPFQVLNYEPPQLAGLNEHMWPFMQNWQKKPIANENNEDLMNETRIRLDKTTQGMKGDYVGEYNNNMKSKMRKYSPQLKNRNPVQPVALPNAENINKKSPKMRPMRQFKEKMLQFLHKKSSFDDDNKKYFPEERTNERKEVSNNVVDFGINTQSDLVISNQQDKILSYKEDKMLNYISSNKEKPWAKGRWASDFIDNVIKKIKSGIYYNQDEKDFSRIHNCITKEDSVQTEFNCNHNDFCKNCMQKSNLVSEQNDKACDLFKTIPGFENNLLDLQIETINKNQIAIKHCVTNIVVQFDVALACEINHVPNVKQSTSCIPVPVTESHAKIFKSKTMIVNAMLPAELCTILPNMMRKIIDNKAVVLPKIVDKVETHLSTIAELTRCESSHSIKHQLIHIGISPELKILGQGMFCNDVSTIITKRTSYMAKISHDSFEGLYAPNKINLLPILQTNLLFNSQFNLNTLHIFESHQTPKVVPECNFKRLHNKTSTCMELQPYVLSNKQVVPAYSFNIFDMVSVFLTNRGFGIQLNMPLTNQFNNLCFNKNVNIISMGVKTVENKVYCISDVDFPYNDFQEHLQDDTRKKLENTAQSQIIKFENCKSGAEYCVTNYKHKKRTFVKLYKKCKSMSNISNERSSTALRKITNLDDFFLALGSAKALASVIDGTTERKVLASIKEMKNWIKEITPRQALLILLLANKKDTSNVVRYRPIILQGIAVNRITRASELDMEIEVIDRENLNTFSQYEGISYLPASVENQGSLLEELCWIAKTTASDYQRPFDESSERLLKSLLEKRKKLNPSYLRVMARYVGLGLLKSPK